MHPTKSLQGTVVVIVGASSGIGRSAALEFAAHGAYLVLAARRADVLEELAKTCESIGGLAFHLPTDVTREEELQRLAVFAMEKYGRIDVWVNNAGAGVMGMYDEVPMPVHEQVVRVSLLGHMYGAHPVLPWFKRQQQGILINTISIGAFVPETYSVAYTASKFGLRGMSEALRAELISWPAIKVCDVFPSYIDTPGFEHAANHLGKKLRPVPPVYHPRQVARAMVRLALQPKSATIVGASGSVMKLFYSIFPSLTRAGLKMMMDNYFHRARPAPISEGALFQPMNSGIDETGGWRSKKENAVVNIAASAFTAMAVIGIIRLIKMR